MNEEEGDMFDRLYEGYASVIGLLTMTMDELPQDRCEYLLSVVFPFHVDEDVLHDIIVSLRKKDVPQDA